MRTGADISIQTCRDEGYTVMDYPVYALRNNPTTTDCTFTWSLPNYIRKEMCLGIGDAVICATHVLNYNDLFEMYSEDKESINSLIGDTHKRENNPDPFDLLNLASDLMSYGSLDYDDF